MDCFTAAVNTPITKSKNEFATSVDEGMIHPITHKVSLTK